jgi:hypothetical protein
LKKIHDISQEILMAKSGDNIVKLETELVDDILQNMPKLFETVLSFPQLTGRSSDKP